jgi:sec-independent protein translocase protein TatB
MLPSLGFNEIIILGILALVVVGPKDLPLLFRKLGNWTAKLRGMAQEFRTGFDELARQAELDELKREVEALRRTTSVSDITRELSKPLPTLEDYAGVSSTKKLEAPASVSAPGRTPSVTPADEAVADVVEAAPAEPAAASASKHTDEQPVARSAS